MCIVVFGPACRKGRVEQEFCMGIPVTEAQGIAVVNFGLSLHVPLCIGGSRRNAVSVGKRQRVTDFELVEISASFQLTVEVAERIEVERQVTRPGSSNLLTYALTNVTQRVSAAYLGTFQ